MSLLSRFQALVVVCILILTSAKGSSAKDSITWLEADAPPFLSTKAP